MRSATNVYKSLHFTVIGDGAVGAGPVLFGKQTCGRGCVEQVQKIQDAKNALEVSLA